MNFTQTLILAYFIFAPFSHVLLSLFFDYNEDQMTKKKLMLYICACIGWPILIPIGFIKFFITYWKSLPDDLRTTDEEVYKPESFDLDNMRFKNEEHYPDFSRMVKQSKK